MTNNNFRPEGLLFGLEIYPPYTTVTYLTVANHSVIQNYKRHTL